MSIATNITLKTSMLVMPQHENETRRTDPPLRDETIMTMGKRTNQITTTTLVFTIVTNYSSHIARKPLATHGYVPMTMSHATHVTKPTQHTQQQTNTTDASGT